MNAFAPLRNSDGIHRRLQRHYPLLLVVVVGILPLAGLREGREPGGGLLFGGQLVVVLEDDGGGVACFEGDLVGALHGGDAVADEGVAQDVAGPLDAESPG